jgi:tetratricopeptide (TPR) repeat protein
MVLGSPGAERTTQSVSLGLAAQALRSGNVVQARQMLNDRIAQYPEDADALQLLAEVARVQKSIEEATFLLRRAVAADPNVDRRMALVMHLQRHGSHALALEEVEQLPQGARETFEVRAIEVSLLGILGMHDRQVQLLQAMARGRPKDANLWVMLGNALKTVGRADEAIKALQRALRAQPTSGNAWWTLANFKSFKFALRDITQMRAALRERLTAEDALHIHFALGKALEDRGDYEQSFRHYAFGNALRAREFTPDQVAVTKEVDQAIAAFTPDLFERNKDAGFAQEGPIFVVGLHRSGSTLIEQILASHPMVEGTAELVVMKSIRERLARLSHASAAAAVAALKPADFRAIGEEYLDRTRAFRHTDRPFFIDKLPGNWLNLALIRLALPNAKIVDARRHPMACGFSNFKQNYAAGVGFSYSLATIGAFYRDYWRFMAHFEALQPGVVCRMINEELIEDPEGEVRRMLGHLQLPFDQACLEFHKTDRAIRTPSAEQVRRPINREGVDYWRHYEPWLGELKESLGPALDHWAD